MICWQTGLLLPVTLLPAVACLPRAALKFKAARKGSAFASFQCHWYGTVHNRFYHNHFVTVRALLNKHLEVAAAATLAEPH
jgi:hypothetical protein